MDELWKSVLDEIEVEVSGATFHTFFRGTHLHSFENNVATISAPTLMITDWIEKRFYSIIKKVIDKKTNQDVSLVFITAPRVLSPSQTKSNVGPLFSEIEKPVVKRERPVRIKKDYTFDSFAVSESNQLAYTACQTVALSPGDKYNPVFLYGTVGVGKTHLMHAIANTIYEKNNAVKVLYLTTEEFTNEVVEAIRDKSTIQLRNKFRNVDLLLLDDVQFLSGKEKVQEELFHTFNSLIEKGKQVIFTSDRPPSELKKIEARLASRFEGGLTVDIEPPDFELRTAILLMKSEKYDVELSIDMAKLVAERITDTRALEGFLLRLTSFINSQPHQTVTSQVIMRLLGNQKEKQTVIKPDNVIDTICDFYTIKPTQLKGKKRDAHLVRPRHVCMYLLKEEAGLTFAEIGNLLGGRDHTTVMHAVDKINSMLNEQGKASEEVIEIKRKIHEDFMQ